MRFLLQYLKNPRSVGAIAPSSVNLARKMINSIDFKNLDTIVEYGPGTGVFTEQILQRKKSSTKLILLELNKEFYINLKNKYGDREDVEIINDSAENILNYVSKSSIDYIVSGLPFTSLPHQISENILTNTKLALSKKGLFITFQYTKTKTNLFKTFFKDIKINREFMNLPPAYVLECSKS